MTSCPAQYKKHTDIFLQTYGRAYMPLLICPSMFRDYSERPRKRVATLVQLRHKNTTVKNRNLFDHSEKPNLKSYNFTVFSRLY